MGCTVAEAAGLGISWTGTYHDEVDLVERDHERAVLTAAVGAACAGQGSAVAISGDAGAGKTTLVQSVTSSSGLRDMGLRVLRGSCEPLRTPRPLGPLRDAAAQAGFRLLPHDDGEPPAAVYEELYQHLRGEPTVLVVEDLHWVDAATADAVRFLIRRIDAMPLALMVTYRDDEIGTGHPGRALLGDVARSEHATTVRLHPLSVSGVRTLLGGTDLDATTVHGLTGGNPFYVTEIVKEPDRPLPGSVRDVVLARIADVAPEDVEVLQLLATAPDRLDERALPVLGVDLPTLRRLDATSLLTRDGAGLTFRHDLARQSIESTIPPGGAHTLHRRLLDALERLEPHDPAVLTHHAVAAGDAQRSARYAKAAALEATRAGSHSEAVAFYQIALGHLNGAAPGERADLLQRLGYEQYMTGRLEQAIDNVRATFPLWRAAGDLAGLATAYERCAIFEYYHSRRREAEAHIAQAGSIAEDSRADLALGNAQATSGYLAYMRSDLDAAAQCLADAARTAQTNGAEALTLRARLLGSVLELCSGRLAARADLVEHIETARALGFDELASTGYSHVCALDVEQRRLRDAEKVLEESIPFTIYRDIPICRHWQTAFRARLRLTEARWQAALEDADQVLGEDGMPLARLWPYLVTALVPLRTASVPTDDPNVGHGGHGGHVGHVGLEHRLDRQADDHLDHLERAWALAGRLDEPLRRLPVLSALAERMWLTGVADSRVVGEAASALTDIAARPGTEWAVGELAAWLHRLDLPVPAVADVAAAVAGPFATVLDGRHDDAATRWLRIGEPFAAAMALSESPEHAHQVRAVELLDQIGAFRAADRLRVGLRRTGLAGIPVRARAVTRANPGGLTNRQLDVAKLVARGFTNAEIASRLYISPKTADHHVSAVLAKLGVPSRRTVVVRADELGLS